MSVTPSTCKIRIYITGLLCVHSSFATISMGKRELVALFCLSSWCLMIVMCLFLTMPWVCLQFLIVVFPDHTHLLFLKNGISIWCARMSVFIFTANIKTS